jgi:hypothetical protein
MTAYVPFGNRRVIMRIEKQVVVFMHGSIGERRWRVKRLAFRRGIRVCKGWLEPAPTRENISHFESTVT